MVIENMLRAEASVQVSYLQDITGDFESSVPFLIYNTTGESITLTIKPYNNDDPIATKIEAGWNPILCKAVYGAPADALQIGY